MDISKGEVTQQEALLSTKISVPKGRPYFVPRVRLMDPLNEAFDRKLTFVSAPPGSGKTTLLGQWSAQSKHPVAWLSLDRDDNDLCSFFAHLVGALQSIEPQIDGHAVAFLQATEPESTQAFLVALNNEIGANSDRACLSQSAQAVTEAHRDGR